MRFARLSLFLLPYLFPGIALGNTGIPVRHLLNDLSKETQSTFSGAIPFWNLVPFQLHYAGVEKMREKKNEIAEYSKMAQRSQRVILFDRLLWNSFLPASVLRVCKAEKLLDWKSKRTLESSSFPVRGSEQAIASLIAVPALKDIGFEGLSEVMKSSHALMAHLLDTRDPGCILKKLSESNDDRNRILAVMGALLHPSLAEEFDFLELGDLAETTMKMFAITARANAKAIDAFILRTRSKKPSGTKEKSGFMSSVSGHLLDDPIFKLAEVDRELSWEAQLLDVSFSEEEVDRLVKRIDILSKYLELHMALFSNHIPNHLRRRSASANRSFEEMKHALANISAFRIRLKSGEATKVPDFAESRALLWFGALFGKTELFRVDRKDIVSYFVDLHRPSPRNGNKSTSGLELNYGNFPLPPELLFRDMISKGRERIIQVQDALNQAKLQFGPLSRVTEISLNGDTVDKISISLGGLERVERRKVVLRRLDEKWMVKREHGKKATTHERGPEY